MEERGRGECGLERSLLTSLARFCRVLRLWGVRLSAGASHTAIEALREIEVTNREDFRHALRITLVQRPEDFPLFTYLFNAFWATRGAREQLRPNEELGGRPVDAKRLGREVEADEEMAPGDTGVRHLEGAVGIADAELEGLHWSRAAVTGGRPQQDIAHGDPLERSELLRLADRLSTALATRASRRRVRDASGRFADPRGMLRDSLRYGGIPVEFRWKTRRVTRTRLLLFCDVSRSMDECVAFFLRFAAAVLRRLWRVDIFLFATDIVRVTNVWTGQSWDELKLMIPDVGGGTQIGKCLERFLESYDTSLLGPGTVVMILSDGLEAGDPALLDSAMERLRRRAHAVIWLNPLLHLEGYEPRAAGMAVALKHVDVFAPVHDNASMWELVDTIRGVAKRRRGGFMASVIRERERISKVPSHHGAATLKHGGVPAEESSGIVRDE